MVQRLVKLAEKAVGTAKNILFADPELLYEEERHLLNQPFFFEGTNGKCVLLVHGWTSTAYEVRRLGKYLNENGFTVSGPMLRGHGTKPEDLDNLKWQDWLEDLIKIFDELKKEYGDVYVAGTSIGASLVMLLAAERPEAKKLVLMATPYEIKFEKILEVLGKFLVLAGKKFNKKYYPPTFGVSTTVTRLISYQKYSINSSLEVLSMIRTAKMKIQKITQPVFLIQSRQDHIVTKNSLEKIYDKVGSEIKRKKYIKRAYHTFISDIKNESVFEDILNFLNDN
jgi:carboxylesterase